MPVVGLLIVVGGWRSPFLVVAVLGVASVVVARVVPGRTAAGASFEPSALLATPPGVAAIRPVERAPAGPRVPTARRVCVAAALVMASGEAFSVVYGEWLAVDLRLSVAGIGVSVVAIVAAELVGDGLVSVASDRVGPARMAIVAAGVATAAYLALGLVGGRLAAAVAVTAVVFVAFEVAVVSVLASLVPVAEDDGPGLFGRLMGAVAVGAVLALVLFARGGIVLVGAGAGLAAFVGV